MNCGQASLIVGTAGHIDHGKTALVEALTGIDADRLPEEKRRGITIDLGFASTELPSKDGTQLCLSFIDVPGHRLFIRNMLAGAAGIDCVMLVISAEDGIMPQTEEHVAICRLLGITRGVVVLTKIDLVTNERLAQAREEVAGFMVSSFLRGSSLVCVSIMTGEGLPQLREELAQLASSKPIRSQTELLRLPVDRAFVVRGFGTVATGTLKAGSLTHGKALVLEPGGVPVRARGLQTHHHSVDQALAGSRVAVNLSGAEVSDVHRGQTLVEPQGPTAVDLVDAEIELLAGSPELRHKASVRFHCFTSETLARVLFYVNRPLQPGARALVRLKLAKPVVVLPQDRFVLRRLSPMSTIGGGSVLDAHPILRTRKTKTAAWLEQINRATPPEQLLLRVARRESAGLSTAALSRELGWIKDAVTAAAQPMIESGELLTIGGDLLLTTQTFSAAQVQVLDCLTRMEDKKPNHLGWKRSELRHQTGLEPDVFDAVLAQLVNARKLRVAGAGAAEVVALYQDFPQLPEADRKAMERIAAAYKSPGLQAPLFSEVMRNMGLEEAEARRLMTLLLREKILVKLGAADLFMHRVALTRLQEEIASLRGQSLDVGRFKQITGLSRKYAIPLLEYLDRVHVTRKQGDTRLVL